MQAASPTDVVALTTLFQLLGQVPTLLVLMAGIVVFLVTVRRSPVARVLSAGSFALLLCGRITHAVVTNMILAKQHQAGWTVATVSRFLGASSLAFAIVEAAAFGMLIGAVLAGRVGKDAPG